MTRRQLYLASMTINVVGMVSSAYIGSVGWFLYNAVVFCVTGVFLPPAPAPAESPRS